MAWWSFFILHTDHHLRVVFLEKCIERKVCKILVSEVVIECLTGIICGFEKKLNCARRKKTQKNQQPLYKIFSFGDIIISADHIIKGLFGKNMCQKTRKKYNVEKKRKWKIIFMLFWKTYKSIEHSSSSGFPYQKFIKRKIWEHTEQFFLDQYGYFLLQEK